MHKKKIYAIIVILGLLTLTAYSTVDAQTTEPEAPKYPALERLKYYVAHRREFKRDRQALQDAVKELRVMIRNDIINGKVFIGNGKFEIPQEWLNSCVAIMELSFHLFGHGGGGQLCGAVCIGFATWLPLRFVARGETIDSLFTGDLCGLLNDGTIEECYDRFGVVGCLILLTCALPLLIPFIAILFPIGVRSYHLDLYEECLMYAIANAA